VVSNIAGGTVRTGDTVVVKQRRLDSQTIVFIAAFNSLTVEAEKNIETIGDLSKTNLPEQASSSLLGNGVAQGADAVVCVVNSAGMGRIVVNQSKRLAKGPQVAFRGHSDVVAMKNAPHRQTWLCVERKLHTAVSNPEHIPVVTIRRNLWRHRFWQVIYCKFADRFDTCNGLRIAGVGVIVRSTQRLGQGVCRDGKIAEERSDTNIPVRVIFQN